MIGCMETKITVIMPVYNTGKYLYESLDSIFAQTFKEFDLICVDDCSDDLMTLDILSQYEKEHINMRVIHFDRNRGAAEARNEGLHNADGKYVIFLDADDIFHSNLLQRLYDSAMKWNADMCVCAGVEFCKDLTNLGNVYGISLTEEYRNCFFSAEELGNKIFQYISVVPWNRMCLRQFLIDQQIEFQSLPSANDVYYSICCDLLARRIVCVDTDQSLIYHRVGDNNCISSNRNPFYFYEAMRKVYERFNCEAHGLYSDLIKERLVWGSVFELKSCNDRMSAEKYYSFISGFIREKINLDKIQDKKNLMYCNYFLSQSYDSGWLDLVGDYYKQLIQNETKLLYYINDEINIVIWGNGKRGKAFQFFCKEQKLKNVYVFDKKSEDIGMLTEYGYPMISEKSVFDIGNTIFASNTMIYHDIVEKCVNLGRKCVNLQNYCLLD